MDFIHMFVLVSYAEKVPAKKAEVTKEDIEENLVDGNFNANIRRKIIDLMLEFKSVFSKDKADYQPIKVRL